jgi:hypothetical protein
MKKAKPRPTWSLAFAPRELPMTLKLPIYIDYAATTPCDPRVVDTMLPYFTEKFGNAASRSHAAGWVAEEAVEYAREQVAKLIGAGSEKEIAFTSGATESDNLAIKGVAHFYASKGNHIITCKTEHKAVLDTCKRLEKEGFSVTYLQPDAQGRVTPDDVAKAITDKTILVSPSHRGHRQGDAREGRAPALRRRARRRQDRVRRREDERRPREHLGAQDVRAQGRGRVVRAPQQAARAHHGRDGRWRS